MSYALFRKNNDIEQLKNKFNELNGKKDYSDLDSTYWTTNHVGGAEGVGEAIVRFLPAPPDGRGGQEPDSIVKYYVFSVFKNGRAYINRGRNSLGHNEPDPANEYNMSVWARTDISKEEKKKLLVNRNEYYVANIYIVKDPNKPENEGKVMRWRFGRQIYNLINKQLFPEFETDTPCNVFDPIEGADFYLRVTTKKIPDQRTGELRAVPNYENSKFGSPSKRWSLEEFDEIWKQEHSLQSEIAEDKFKSYEELKQQFDRVMFSGTNSRDSDEPIKKQEISNKVKSPVTEKFKSTEEELDDEIPWGDDAKEESLPWDVNEVDAKTSSNNSTTDSVDDDWFSNIR